MNVPSIKKLQLVYVNLVLLTIVAGEAAQRWNNVGETDIFPSA